MALICGIDEAGRGPVIGPLVACGVVIDENKIFELESIGVKDSKLLLPRKREELFVQIKKIVKAYEIAVLTPAEVDNALESENMNLNWLEAKTSADIINKLKPNEAVIDCPSTNIKAYSDYIKNLLIIDVKLVVEHKADLNYPVVAAASILAKVVRDREIEKIKATIGLDVGSGYPSDPKTKNFLSENWNKYPDIFRKTWSSYRKFSDSKKQKKLGDF